MNCTVPCTSYKGPPSVQNKEGHIATSILAVIQSIALIELVFLYTVSLPKAPYYKAWLTAVKTTVQPQLSQPSGTIRQHWLHRLTAAWVIKLL